MIEIEKFSNGPIEGSVRALFVDGQVWFSLTDMVKVLGYANTSNAIRSLKKHQYRTATEVERQAMGNASGRAPYLVTEGGFYRLALRSSRPEAEQFQDWVEEEILPSIRRDGGYIAEGATQEQLDAIVAKYEDRVDRIVEGARKREISIVREADLTEKNKQEDIDEAWGQNHFLGEYLKYLRDFTVHGSSRDAMTQPQFRKNRYRG